MSWPYLMLLRAELYVTAAVLATLTAYSCLYWVIDWTLSRIPRLRERRQDEQRDDWATWTDHVQRHDK